MHVAIYTDLYIATYVASLYMQSSLISFLYWTYTKTSYTNQTI